MNNCAKNTKICIDSVECRWYPSQMLRRLEPPTPNKISDLDNLNDGFISALKEMIFSENSKNK